MRRLLQSQQAQPRRHRSKPRLQGRLCRQRPLHAALSCLRLARGPSTLPLRSLPELLSADALSSSARVPSPPVLPAHVPCLRRLLGHAVPCIRPAPILVAQAAQAVPVALQAVLDLLQAVRGLPSAHVPALAHVLALLAVRQASCQAQARRLVVCVRRHVPVSAAAVNATKRPKKVR